MVQYGRVQDRQRPDEQRAPDFTLPDHKGGTVNLYEALKNGPAMLVFYPGDFTPVCTAQLCNYRDNIERFAGHGVQVFGISEDAPEQHARFAKEFEFPFPLLTDKGQAVAKAYGCTSLFMFGKVSRAVFIINSRGAIVYRYVEPLAITRRKADDLIAVISDLKKDGSI
ncbi:MAG TPA: peroxiredoxin [Bdellovibrionales bacterium]|nr:peroxiredoxin [Bdellovibrionales bacterium]